VGEGRNPPNWSEHPASTFYLFLKGHPIMSSLNFASTNVAANTDTMEYFETVADGLAAIANTRPFKAAEIERVLDVFVAVSAIVDIRTSAHGWLRVGFADGSFFHVHTGGRITFGADSADMAIALGATPNTDDNFGKYVLLITSAAHYVGPRVKAVGTDLCMNCFMPNPMTVAECGTCESALVR
jgi:hypothetical protein